MLNAETKRRIDACRDILVGKIPSPQAQVEQITIALMYKFMNDLDHEVVDLGGTSQFFSGEFGKYSWDRIVDPRIGGEDRIRLYAEGLEKVGTNTQVPELFRQIFKNAFLPYRDPETFNLFSQAISGFRYEHSEDLGDAFEYLLSVLQSQGDAGQFRTPRHIIDFMAEVVAPQPGETILDPACGTAGFLIAAYKYIRKNHPKLSPEKLEALHRNVTGYDISPDMVRLSRVNLYLHQFADPQVSEYDTLTDQARWGDRFDIILANPPFMTPKGGIRPHRKFSLESNRSEVLFVDYIAEHLKAEGRGAVIVPEGIIFQSGKAYKQLRRMLLEGHLWGVVSLPAGVFNPYSGVKTSILLLDRKVAEKGGPVLFVQVKADGYDLGAQRRPVAQNDLPGSLKLIREVHHQLSQGVIPADFRGSLEGMELGHLLVPRSLITQEADCNLSGERYRPAEARGPRKWPMVKLGEVCEINPKKAEVRNLDPALEVSFVPMEDLQERRANFIPQKTRLLSEVLMGYTYFRDRDVLLARVTPCFENGKAGIAENLKNGIGFGSSEYTVLRAGPEILPELIYQFILSEKFATVGKEQMTGTGGLQRLPNTFVSNFQIPLPPLSVQEEIVAEVRRYQAVIDGAWAVVENWKPSFTVNPDWPVVKLGEVCEFKNGLNYEKNAPGEEIKILGVKDFQNYDGIRLDRLDSIRVSEELTEDYLLKNGDIIFVRSNGNRALVGRSILAEGLTENITFSGFTIRARFTGELQINPKYGLLFFKSPLFLAEILDQIQGANIGNINQKILSQVDLPVPPLPIQHEIVARIEAERALVKANEELITMMKKRIEETVEKVWG